MELKNASASFTSQRSKRSPPRCLVIGAGSRGNAYARAVSRSTGGIVAAIAEPVEFKRAQFGRTYIWQERSPFPGQEFGDWKEFLKYELNRRERAAAGEQTEEAIDAAFICTLDEHHAEIITALAPLKLHLMSEKPLAVSLVDCLKIYRSLSPAGQHSAPTAIFGIGHVLR